MQALLLAPSAEPLPRTTIVHLVSQLEQGNPLFPGLFTLFIILSSQRVHDLLMGIGELWEQIFFNPSAESLQVSWVQWLLILADDDSVSYLGTVSDKARMLV